MDRKAEEWNTILLGETLLLGLLGRFWYSQPDREWLQSLIAEDVFSEVPFGGEHPETQKGLAILQGWAEANRSGLSDDAFDDLRADYTRLLVGADKVLAAPWESVHFSEERMVFQEQTLDVRAWYRRFGLEPELLHKEPDDHIGLELTFVSYLARLAMQALEAGDEHRFQELIDAQRDFMARHLLAWGPFWTGLVERSARTDLFKGMALLTRGALLAVASELVIPVPEVKLR